MKYDEKTLREAFRSISKDYRWSEANPKGNAFVPLDKDHELGLKFCFNSARWYLTMRFDCGQGEFELCAMQGVHSKYEDIAEAIDRFCAKVSEEEDEENALLREATNQDQEALSACKIMLHVCGFLDREDNDLIVDFGSLGLDHIKRARKALGL